jgi:hypothetical protein
MNGVHTGSGSVFEFASVSPALAGLSKADSITEDAEAQRASGDEETQKSAAASPKPVSYIFQHTKYARILREPGTIAPCR